MAVRKSLALQIKRSGSSFSHYEKGSAIIEFAIVMPLVTSLIFGIVQYGLIFNSQTILKDIASSAARYATLASQPSAGDVQNYVTTLATAMSINTAYLTTTVQAETVGGFSDARSVSLVYRQPVYFTVPGTDNTGRFVIRIKTIGR
jgi:Flp pilus assembly protein TadG